MTSSTDNAPETIKPRGVVGSLFLRLASAVLPNLPRVVRFLTRAVANGFSPNL